MREVVVSPGLLRWRNAGAATLVGTVVGSIGLVSTGLVSSADAAQVTGGNAVVNVDRSLTKRMSNQAVTVNARRPATNRRNTVRFALRGGNFVVDTNNPAPLEPLAIENLSGQTALRGGLKFTRRARGARRSVNVTNLRVNLERRRVTAKIGRRNAVLFTINMAWATPAGEDALRPRLLAAPLKVTPAAARLINRGLGRQVLRKNSGFGLLHVAPALAAD